MRAIDADRLSQSLYHEAFETDSDMQRWDSGCWIRYKMFENAIDAAPTIDVPQWIPCAERLPEKYIGEWLCCTDDGRILVLPYDTPGDGSKECVFYRWDDRGDMYETYNVIAWMPLPEPYKEDE